MSFILDALRKSEHERQRQAGPTIAEIPIARPAAHPPVALIALGALLAVNLAVVLYFLLRNDAPEVVPEPAGEVVQAAPAPLSAAEPARLEARAPPEPIHEVRPLADEVPAETSPPVSAEPPPAPDPSLLPTVPTATPPARQSVPPSSDEFVPRLDALPPQATAGLPTFNLDLHIYATDPAQRAVFINGQRYREGDELPQGVEIASITPEGAVLRHRGQRFLLPRQ